MKNCVSITTGRVFTGLVIAVIASFAAAHEACSATMYTDTNSTGAWISSRWSTSAGGPFTSAWSGGSDAYFFAGGNYDFSYSANNINFASVTVENNATVKSTNSTGTLIGGGTKTITVQTNAVLDLGIHLVSSTAGASIIKNGSGILAWTGGQFSNGFTMNGGTLIMRHANAMGQGGTNVLTWNGGTLAVLTSSNTLTVAAGKYGGGVFIAGDIQFGALSNAYATNQQYLISDDASFIFQASASLENAMRTMTIGGNGDYTLTGVLSNGGLTVNAASNATGNLILSGINTYTGGTVINGGTLQLGSSGTTNGSVIGNITNNATLAINWTASKTLANNISGTGALKQIGSQTTTLTGGNTFTGATTVSAGTLALNATSGSALGGTTHVTVASSAILLISKSSQVNNSAAVTLSGGTIQRAGGVSETFGDLNLTAASFLDYGTAHDPGDEGTLTFGTYTPSSLLTVNNFFEGNKLVFSSNIGSDINNTNLFKFDNGFSTNWNGSTFTITAIPEPSTYFAAAGLIGLMLLWRCRTKST